MEQEITAILESGWLGSRGRLLDLFNYLTKSRDNLTSPKESELAANVFNKSNISKDGDDASVRVYIHRLRKKLESYYLQNDVLSTGPQITLPVGEYRLVLQENKTASLTTNSKEKNKLNHLLKLAVILVPINILAWLIITNLNLQPFQKQTNSIWTQFNSSDRPIMLVVGDYFLFSEMNPNNFSTRLIRDYQINSSVDFVKNKMDEPMKSSNARDINLQYLPTSIAYSLKDILPLIQQRGRPLHIIQASKADAGILKDNDVIYMGLLSGLAFLKNAISTNSSYQIGISFDQIIDGQSGEIYESGEIRGLALDEVYKDYGYFSFRKTPDDHSLVIISGTRDTGLRGISEIVSQPELPEELMFDIDASPRFEALVEIRGQHQANIGQKIISTNQRAN